MRLPLAILLLASACSAKKPAPATPSSTPTGEPAAAAPVVTLKDLQNGDRACYVVVETGAGEESLEGDFDLCAGGSNDATALIGKRVTYTTQKANVLAASCALVVLIKLYHLTHPGKPMIKP